MSRVTADKPSPGSATGGGATTGAAAASTLASALERTSMCPAPTSLSGNWLIALALHGRLQRVPRQRRALDAHRELANPGEDGELAEVVRGRRRLGGEQLVDAGEELARLHERLAAQALGHERRRGRRDGAPRPLEGGLPHELALHRQVDRELVATQRVHAGGAVRRLLQSPEVPRALVMVEDDLLVEVAQLRHQTKTFLTFCNAETRRSISSRVLYMAKEA